MLYRGKSQLSRQERLSGVRQKILFEAIVSATQPVAGQEAFKLRD